MIACLGLNAQTVRMVAAYPHLKAITRMDPTSFREELAATHIQTAFKLRKARREMEKQRVKLQAQVAELWGRLIG